jgi:antitoxin (DNA-binding transcriptional repressor) of toxin-antitoxin stability system
MSRALAAGRAVLPLLAASRAVVAEWGRFTGPPSRGGHDDMGQVAAAVGRLRDALAELGSPRHQMEMYSSGADATDYGSLGQRTARALYRARRGETTEVTIGGQRAALIIPAGRVQAAVTPGLVLELATMVTGGRTHAVISRDRHGYRAEPRTTAEAARRTVVTDRAVLDAWTAGEPLDDESIAAFAAATMAGLDGGHDDRA